MHVDQAKLLFEEIRTHLAMTGDHIAPGKMMSAEAIQYKKKVFAFFHDGRMTFKLGKEFDLETFGIDQFQYLSPFKNKPPMKTWYEIPGAFADQWAVLAEQALLNIQKEVK